MHRNRNYPIDQIGNVDEAPTFLDIPFSYIVDKRGTKEVRVHSTANERTRVTVMLACTAVGHKVQPFLIFRRKTPQILNFPTPDAHQMQ